MRYDAVLCHAVLPYVGDPQALTGALGQLAGPGAVLSLVFKNADALAMRPALEGRWSDALDASDAAKDVGSLGVSPEPITDATLRGGRRRPVTELIDVLPVEIEATRRGPYRALGRLIHLVACQDG